MGLKGREPGQASYPAAIAVDRQGNIYVADRDNNRIQKFDASGVFVTEWGVRGQGHSQFDQPCSISTDSGGYVYVADSGNLGNGRIQKFSPSGAFIVAWSLVGKESRIGPPRAYVKSIAIDRKGSVYALSLYDSTPTAQRIWRLDPTGRRQDVWGAEQDLPGRSPGRLASGPDGSIYMGANGIDKCDPTGAFLAHIDAAGQGAITVDSAGVLYVGDEDYGKRIEKFAPDGKALLPVEPRDSHGSWGDSAIAVDHQGRIYLEGNATELHTFDKNGDWAGFLDGKRLPEGRFGAISGVSVGPDGTLYLVDARFNRVYRMSTSGELLAEWVLGPSITGDADIVSPTAGLAVDGSGRVFVARNVFSGCISILDPSGKELGALGKNLYADEKVAFWGQVVVGKEGSIYATEGRSRAVHQFVPVREQ